MTSFFLFLSDVFMWSFGLFDAAGNVLNWILFLVASALFTYWCYVLMVTLGGDKDKEYFSGGYAIFSNLSCICASVVARSGLI